jgi:hypothetical protein
MTLRPNHSKIDSKTARPATPLRLRATEPDSRKVTLLIQRSEAPKIISVKIERSGSPKKMASTAELSTMIRSSEEAFTLVTQDFFRRSWVKDWQGIRQFAEGSNNRSTNFCRIDRTEQFLNFRHRSIEVIRDNEPPLIQPKIPKRTVLVTLLPQGDRRQAHTRTLVSGNHQFYSGSRLADQLIEMFLRLLKAHCPHRGKYTPLPARRQAPGSRKGMLPPLSRRAPPRARAAMRRRR